MSKMPFMFLRMKNKDYGAEVDKYIVMIASCFDYTYYNSAWMDDPDMPVGCIWKPDVDLCESQHEFDMEAEMIQFVADWWIDNYKDKRIAELEAELEDMTISANLSGTALNE